MALLIWGNGLEGHAAEYGFAAVKQQIIPGAAVGHVGKAVAAGIIGAGYYSRCQKSVPFPDRRRQNLPEP